MATTSTSTSNKICADCEWWQENGDGSQKLCDCIDYLTEDTTTADNKKREATIPDQRKRKYISIDVFNRKAKLVKPDTVLKWRELDVNATFYINKIVERMVTIDSRKRKSRYVELDDIVTGERKNAWLTSLLDEEIKKYDLKVPTYIRNLGLKNPVNGGRSYYDFVIVQDDKEH